MPTRPLALSAAALILTGVTAVAEPAHQPLTRAQRVARYHDLRATLGRVRVPDRLKTDPCLLGPGLTPCDSMRADAAPGEPAAGPAIVEEATIETPSGFLALAELPGVGHGAYLRTYYGGDLGADDGDGTPLWVMPGREFIARANGLKNPSLAPAVMLGTDPTDPMTMVGEDPFAVGDVTGDGAADVVVAHHIQAGTRMPDQPSGLVSVLDGRTGEFVWSQQLHGYVVNLALVGDTLVVGHETGERRGLAGEAGSVSTLRAWRFSARRHTVTATPVWAVPATGWARWLSIEPLGSDAVAAAWSDTQPGSGASTHGHLHVVDLTTGAVRWSRTTGGYPRTVRYDASRDQVVALEQRDPIDSQQVGYDDVARAAATGATAATVSTTSAVALAFQVADVNGGQAEWVVNDGTLLPTEYCGKAAADGNEVYYCTGNGGLLSGRVRALDPGTGGAAWTYERRADPAVILSKRPSPQPYGLLVERVGGRAYVVVASYLADPEVRELAALDGVTGTPVWAKRGRNLLLPYFLAPYRGGGTPAILAAPSRINLHGANVSYLSAGDVDSGPVSIAEPYQVVSAYAVQTGAVLHRNPVLANVYAAQRADVGRGKTRDLVVGGESGTVFALDGATLGNDPDVLWERDLGGQIRKLDVADLDGDGRDEIVAVASTSVAVLDSRTGSVRYRLPYADDFVWSSTVADVDGDVLPDVVVPGRGLTAYKGTDGRALWTYAPDGPALTAFFGTTAVAPDRTVVSQFVLDPAAQEGVPAFEGNQNVVALDGRTGAVRWEDRNMKRLGLPDLWHGVVVGPMPGIDGIGAAVTWDDPDDLGFSYPRTDVYDLRTGTLAYTGASPSPDGNRSTVLVPGLGTQQVNSVKSTLVGPEGATQNLPYLFPYTMRNLPDGRVVLVGSSAVTLMRKEGLTKAQHQPYVEGFYFRPQYHGGAVLGDATKDGQELLVYQFDWTGYGASSLPTGRFGFSIDIISRAFLVLRVAGP